MEYYILFGTFVFFAVLALIVHLYSGAAVFAGVGLIWLGLAYISSGIFQPRIFTAFHVFMFLGMFMLLFGINARISLSSTNLFELGSFALVVSTFLLSRQGDLPDFYYSTIFRSVTATTLFFLAGAFIAFSDILSSVPNPTPPNQYVIQAMGAFFLVAIMDLLTVGIEFYTIAVQRYKNQHQPHPVPA